MVNRKAYGPQTNQDGYLSWGVKNDVKFPLSHILLYLALAKDERTSLKKKYNSHDSSTIWQIENAISIK